MKHLVAIILAVLLPLQLSWGVAAAYCQHDTTVTGAMHFGHHTHDHVDAKHDAKTVAGGKLLVDNDCGYCHASLAVVLPGVAALSPASTLASVLPALGGTKLASAPQRVPDRPQWLVLA